ncbi:MAG TPA: hypothetical protein PLC79_11685, partial [Phycisphaerae bacterium]|nr:hypothetical protein [Phycisphaerae bacterium]
MHRNSVAAGEAPWRKAWRTCATPVAVFVLYAAITAGFWAPAGSRFVHQFIGDGGDNFVFVWNPWWVARCLAEHRSPYFCELQYAPFGTPLVFHCLALIPTLVIAGLTKLLSLPLAYNLVAAGLSPVAGLCAYALANHVTRDRAAAVAGGVVFMLCPYMASKLLGHMNLSCAAFLPLYTLWLFRAVDEGGRAHLLWLDQSVWNPKVRDKFFPEVPITYSLETCVVDRGQVVQRTTIAEGGEGKSSVIPGYARFQKTPDGRLFVFYYCSGADETGKGIA